MTQPPEPPSALGGRKQHRDSCATLCTESLPSCDETHDCWCAYGRLTFAEIEDLCKRDPELDALIMADR